MYDAAQGARDAGVSLGFLGSDAIGWQARFEASPGGAANRVLVCYKTADPPNPVDPITAGSPGLTTTQWRLAPVNRPEQSLIGVQFSSQTGAAWNNTQPYVVTNSGNWVYANSGFTDGSRVSGLAGLRPTGYSNNFEARQPVPDRRTPCQFSVYQHQRCP